ncbi:MAG: tRNA (guanosine(46)-N7)-methyltransferase TrmB [Muribaculaceae bacterium]|nr:tRNA (guanosine(46)-N7)-methyltransferase TrmB [Muribaculaceae bacterium]
MGKNKLRKFAEMEQMDRVLQYPFATLKEQEFPLRGKWGQEMFGNDNPIVLELGCGKGEYTVGLARLYPDKNFIGIDIKGARMYTGAKQALEEGLANAAFLRTSIELLPAFFAPGEVSEIWITFPDPQMKKVNKRLTSTRFLDLYRKVMTDGGLVQLKTDSPFLYTYTREMLRLNGIEPLIDTADLYADEVRHSVPDIRTHYEQQWLQRGLTIKLLSWPLHQQPILQEPDIEIEPDSYRSYSRDYNSRLNNQ